MSADIIDGLALRGSPQRSSQRNEKQIDVACHIIKLKSHMIFRLKAWEIWQELFIRPPARLILSSPGRPRVPRVATPRASSSTSVACFESPWRTSGWTISSRGHPRCSARQGAPFRPDDPDPPARFLTRLALWHPSGPRRLCARSARRARSSASWKTCSARVCPSRASTSRTAPTSTTRARSTRCVSDAQHQADVAVLWTPRDRRSMGMLKGKPVLMEAGPW